MFLFIWLQMRPVKSYAVENNFKGEILKFLLEFIEFEKPEK